MMNEEILTLSLNQGTKCKANCAWKDGHSKMQQAWFGPQKTTYSADFHIVSGTNAGTKTMDNSYSQVKNSYHLNFEICNYVT